MAEGDGRKKRKLDIDWGKMLGDNKEEVETRELVIVGKEQPPETSDGGSDCARADDRMGSEQFLLDRELVEQIERQRSLLLDMGSKMPDKGKKIEDKIKRLEEEKERRTLCRGGKDADGCKKLMQPTRSGCSDAARQKNDPLCAVSQSKFASSFCKKLDEKTDIKALKASGKEVQDLRSQSSKSESDEELSQMGRTGGCLSQRHDHQKPRKYSPTVYKKVFTEVDKKNGVSSLSSSQDEPASLHDDGKKSSSSYRNNRHQVLPSKDSRHGRMGHQAVIDVDEEEQSKKMTEQGADLPGCMKDEIFYPSSNDPEPVQICFKDMDCLSPEGYLTSPIMNFYIRYIQEEASPVNPAIYDCHFFNTYFYHKLRGAVSDKGIDKDAHFVKLRRWWRGINLFQKAYILIPIHENLHWSLVIICIPAKEDESGPIILHLDSLGFHSSELVFRNIRRFLEKEWNYLKENGVPSDLPIPYRIWKYLPRRIEDKIITVPQQENDSDCGLFVLFFMERFIEEAPKRLKKKDLAMFGKKWFKPEQASCLRMKIQDLLTKQFGREFDKEMDGSELDKETDGSELDKETDGSEFDKETDGLELDKETDGSVLEESEGF